jgi:hypothetical protein
MSPRAGRGFSPVPRGRFPPSAGEGSRRRGALSAHPAEQKAQLGVGPRSSDGGDGESPDEEGDALSPQEVKPRGNQGGAVEGGDRRE